MPELLSGMTVDVVLPPYTFQGVQYPDLGPGSVTVLPARGEPGTAELNVHIANPRPHEAAESGRDFGAWYNAQITGG